MNPINFLRRCRSLHVAVLIAFIATLGVAVVSPRAMAQPDASRQDICTSRAHAKPVRSDVRMAVDHAAGDPAASAIVGSDASVGSPHDGRRHAGPPTLDCPQCLTLAAGAPPEFRWHAPLRVRTPDPSLPPAAVAGAAPAWRPAARGPPQP